ncbi:MAG: sensor histidine kinase [Candidatus Saccharicenans sp.]|uniref:sensor histidine kinase n=1 Tax=Candidatus Saccharicenans sp. TaxID=2819258 RepID=UPI00404A9E5E
MKKLACWWRSRSHKTLLLAACLFLLGLLLLGTSSLLSRVRSFQSEPDILAGLRKSAASIKDEFSRLLSLLEKRRNYFEKPLPDYRPEVVFNLFRQAGLKTEVEGAAWLEQDLTPRLWLGSVADLKNQLTGWPEGSERLQPGSFIIQDRASFYLVKLITWTGHGYLALFELLAFQPQFQSAYVREFNRLQSIGRSGADINFWAHDQDTEALGRFFSRTQDEYLSQQAEETEIRTLYFPLRNEQGQILATVTLNSLQLQRQRIVLPGLIRILAIILAILSFSLTITWLYRSRFQHSLPPRITWVLILAGLIIIRVHLGLLARHYPGSTWPIFNAQSLGLRSPLGLAASPAELFISCLLFFVLIYVSLRIFAPATLWKEPPTGTTPSSSTKKRTVALILLSSGSALAIMILAWFIRRLVVNCNLNLLNFSFTPASLLIYLSLFLALASLLLPVILFSRQLLTGFQKKPDWLGVFLLTGLIFYSGLWFLADYPLLIVIIQAGFWLLLAALSTFPWRTWAHLGLCLLLISVFTYSLLKEFTDQQARTLAEKVLVHLVSSQKTWARTALNQSLAELQKRSKELLQYFKNPSSPDLARSLWNKTLLARFNWNSCLYLQSTDFKLLSSFGLNMPVFAEQTNDLPISLKPSFDEQYLDILGQEKHFLVGYQDFRDDQGQGGRLAIWVSLDPELLPFYYSANPYFELLRLNTLPSLEHFPINLAIFDRRGEPLFQQNKPGLALPAEIRSGWPPDPAGRWLDFRDGRSRYRGFFLALDDNNICVFYQPLKSLRRQFTEFLKLFFLLGVFSVASLLPFLIRHREWWLSRRSFSFRVYLSFLAAGLVPIFFFIFFSQTVVARIFADRFVQEATSRAYFARSILHDFISLQEQTESPAPERPEDLVFWISSTLNNDVNLFKNGRLLSSSRREFFETGLFSEMMDGETYFRLVWQSQPLVVNRRTFGRYSYQALTIPYRYRQDTYFLNLPFPFEKQEISRARAELFEFFLFTSVFFILLIAFLVATIKKMVVLPINQLIRATQEVSLGNLDVRVEHQARDELKSLVDGFNTMVENLKAHEKELAELSQRVAWTEMARKVAHEIKNPLTPIQLSAEHILKVHSDKHPDFDRVLQESISYIISEVENLRRIAGEFMTIARESGTIKTKFDLKELVQELLRPFQQTLSDRISFSLRQSGHDFVLLGDRGKMKVALRNILINAIEAIKGRGRIKINLKEAGEELIVEIKDNGCGIPAEMVDRIFEPYFSTKEKGTGLGLAICRRIVEEHEGSIKLESQPGKGTRVTITLPRRQPE